jgi:hypothetical protein
MTLVVLVGALLSDLGCGVRDHSARSIDVAIATMHVAETRTSMPVAQTRTHVGHSTTRSIKSSVRQGARPRGVFVALFSQALAPSCEGGDEFEPGDDPDLARDDGSQGFAVVPFAGLSMPELEAPFVAPYLWGIQPALGHPHGDEEPPRV